MKSPGRAARPGDIAAVTAPGPALLPTSATAASSRAWPTGSARSRWTRRRFLEVEHGGDVLPLGQDHGGRAGARSGSGREGPHQFRHCREVNTLQVVRPVDVGGVEAVLAWRCAAKTRAGHGSSGRRRSPPPGCRTGRDRRTSAAPRGPAGAGAPRPSSRGCGPKQASAAECAQRVRRRAGPQHPLDLAGAGKPPGRHLDVAALAVRHRVVPEVLVHVLVHRPERQRVARTGADVEIGGVRRLRRRGRHGKMALTTKSTGMRSRTLSGSPGNSGKIPRPYAMISGSAILYPSIQPGYGCASAPSTMAGRTIDRRCPLRTTTARRPARPAPSSACRRPASPDSGPAAGRSRPASWSPIRAEPLAGLRDPLRTGLAVLAPSRAHGPAKHFRPT